MSRKLRPYVKPYCPYNPRKIPHPLLPKVKFQIETILQQGVIFPVTAPTEWCAGIVPGCFQTKWLCAHPRGPD